MEKLNHFVNGKGDVMHHLRRSYLKYVLLYFFILTACNNVNRPEEIITKKDTIPNSVEMTAASIAGNFSNQTTIKVDSSWVNNFFNQYPALSPYKNQIRNFYAARNFSFAWFDKDGQIEQAANLYNRLQNLEQEGLYGKIPYLASLDSLMSSDDAQGKNDDPEPELLLTGLYFYFAEKVWGGLDEKQTREINWYLPRKKVDYEGWLDSLLKKPGGFTGPDEPVFRQYYLLKDFLNKYRSLDQKHAWKLLKADKKSYRIGDSATVLIEIKHRLHLLEDLEGPSDSPVFDTTLEIAVEKFQRRFGMKQDGIIGPQMLQELNISPKERLEQISVNIERSRWVPDSRHGYHLAVNIPAFILLAYNDDTLLWNMKVVVGKSVNKTVIFSGDLKYVVFSPYWNVPTSILKNEVLPGIKRNKNYLAANHMEWNGNSVRQKPGPWNALGQVKFLFPNSFSIYLHDTPSKSLFAESKRAFSHGCIRVAEPKKLALFLLKDDPRWTEKRVTAAMNSGKEQYVTLTNNIPVYITYFTAWVDLQGKLNFRDDIYNRDERLADIVLKQ
jgi:L,D-transpeptidase YcbB